MVVIEKVFNASAFRPVSFATKNYVRIMQSEKTRQYMFESLFLAVINYSNCIFALIKAI